MSVQATEPIMTDEEWATFQMRCPKAWLERVKRHAERLGLSAAAYIRSVTTRAMENDPLPPENPHPKHPKK